MSETEERLIKKAEEFVREVGVLQNSAYIENEFTRQCMVSNRYGTSFTTEKYKRLQKLWYESFNITGTDIAPNKISGKIISCSVIVKAKHTGEFNGIHATGNIISWSGTLDLLLVGNSISFLSALPDTNEMVRQIASVDSKAYKDATTPMASSNLASRFFNDTLLYLDFLGTRLTSRQLEVLCLWVTGRSDSEITRIINVHKSTINTIQIQLRYIFDAPKKYMLYEKLLEMDVMHLINQCLFFMVKTVGARVPALSTEV